ncbi:hypothetical protein FBQ81_14815 [Chloroflexi bacterium CFX6]|nr:hypothetical protein [Chloroflexi bacterium CFX6]
MHQTTAKKQTIYTKQGLWSLFLMCAFPLHLWALILAFRDVAWVTERTNAWDAVGVVAYALLFALIETVLVFLAFVMLGFLVPRRWNPDKRTGFLILLALLLSVWGIISQLLFLWNIYLPAPAIQFLVRSGHPLRYLYAGALAVVLPTVLLPIYLFLKSDGILARIEDLADRLSILVGLYLFLDAIGILIVIIRNL